MIMLDSCIFATESELPQNAPQNDKQERQVQLSFNTNIDEHKPGMLNFTASKRVEIEDAKSGNYSQYIKQQVGKSGKLIDPRTIKNNQDLKKIQMG